MTKGFTLIELMAVITIIAILAAIAIPSYQSFVRKNDIQKVKSIMLMQANELNRWRARQLSYANFTPQSQRFDADNKTYHYPATGTARYDIVTVTITGSGSSAAQSTFANATVATNYVILATPKQAGMPYLALTSKGIQCESTDSTITPLTVFNNSNCGTGSAVW